MKKLLEGIIPPIITPLLDRDTLDIKGLEKLLAYVMNGGVHGIFILGTTGEAPSLSNELKRQLILNTCRIVNGKLPVVVGISDTAFVNTVELANFSKQCGASSVVLAPPYYFPAGQQELIEYYNDVLNEISLPLFLYNIPSTTKINMEPDTVRKLLLHEKVFGIKDSSGDMTNFNYILHKCRDIEGISVLMGPEQLLIQSMLMGGNGGVHAGANLFPEIYVGAYESMKNGDVDTALKLQGKIIEICLSLYSIGKYSSSLIKSIKSSLSIMGICSDVTAEPFKSFKEEERNRVKEQLIKFGVNI